VRALVTGGAGFIGSSIARRLVADGHDVRIVDNFVNGSSDNVPETAELIEADIRDLDIIRKACANVEVVFHQAALRSVPRSVEDPIETNSCNVEGTVSVLVAAKDAGVRRVVYASSSSVYGDQAQPVRRETDPVQPASPYGVSKLAAELYCRTWTQLHGFSTVSLRYFNVFGPRQPRDSAYAAVFPAFIGAVLDGRPADVHWDGEQSRDFTYIDDVVEANLLAASAPASADGSVFNIGAGRPKTVNDVLKAVSDAAGTWIEPNRLPKRQGDLRHSLADTTEAKSVLGWSPKSDWDASVRSTVAWFAGLS